MRLLLLIAFILLAFTQSAHAHGPVQPQFGFSVGLKHPFFVPAHLLAIAALGLRLGRHNGEKVIYPIILFGIALILGHLASLSGFFSSYLEIALLIMTIIIGLLTLMNIEIKPFEVTITSIIVAMLVGVDSGVDAENLSTNLATLSGSAITAFFLYVCWIFLILFVSKLNIEWMKIGIRVIASWITAIAAMVISLFLATMGSASVNF
jgi:urease accessory protein